MELLLGELLSEVLRDVDGAGAGGVVDSLGRFVSDVERTFRRLLPLRDHSASREVYVWSGPEPAAAP